MWAKPCCPWQLLGLHRTFCCLCCPSPPALARQAETSLKVQAEIRVCSSLVPCAEPFTGVFQRAEKAGQGRAGWQCPGSQCWSSALCSARLQTLLSSLNLQPWAEAKLIWMSLAIKVFYLSTPCQFVPVWCMRKSPSGAKPQIKCALKLNLKPWMWMFHNLSWISMERTIVWFW